MVIPRDLQIFHPSVGGWLVNRLRLKRERKLLCYETRRLFELQVFRRNLVQNHVFIFAIVVRRKII